MPDMTSWTLISRTVNKTIYEILHNNRLRRPQTAFPELMRLLAAGLSELSQLRNLSEGIDDEVRRQIANSIRYESYFESKIEHLYLDEERTSSLPALHLLLMPTARFAFSPTIADYKTLARLEKEGVGPIYHKAIESNGSVSFTGAVIPPTFNERSLGMRISQEYGVQDISDIDPSNVMQNGLESLSTAHYFHYGYADTQGIHKEGVDSSTLPFSQGALLLDNGEITVLRADEAFRIADSPITETQTLLGVNWQIDSTNYQFVTQEGENPIPNIFNGIGYYVVGGKKVPFTINTFHEDEISLLLLKQRNPTLKSIALMVDTIAKTIEAESWTIAGLDYRGGGTLFSKNGAGEEFDSSIGPFRKTIRTDAITFTT